jgi:hypothetical protein
MLVKFTDRFYFPLTLALRSVLLGGGRSLLHVHVARASEDGIYVEKDTKRISPVVFFRYAVRALADLR